MLIRQAKPSDSELLWQWRNHESTRKMSLSTQEIPWDEHASWFAGALQSPSQLIVIGESDLATDVNLATIFDEKRFAMLRLDFSENQQGEDILINQDPQKERALISINLNPAYRGQGLAVPFMRRALSWISGHREVLPPSHQSSFSIHATIKSDNVASLRSFEALKFALDPHASTKALKHYTKIFC